MILIEIMHRRELKQLSHIITNLIYVLLCNVPGRIKDWKYVSSSSLSIHSVCKIPDLIAPNKYP